MEEDISSGEIVTSTDDEEDYYVIIKGRQPSDTGIYGTWSETAPKVQDGVSAPIHKKCTGSKEAKKYLAMGGIPDAEINQHMEKVKEKDRVFCTVKAESVPGQ